MKKFLSLLLLTSIGLTFTDDTTELKSHLKELSDWVKKECPADQTPEFLNSEDLNNAALEDALNKNLDVVFEGPWAEAAAKNEADKQETVELAKAFGSTISLKSFIEKHIQNPIEVLNEKQQAFIRDAIQNALIITHKAYKAYYDYKKPTTEPNDRIEKYVIGYTLRPIFNAFVKQKIRRLSSSSPIKILQTYALQEIYKQGMKKIIKKDSVFAGNDWFNDAFDLVVDAYDLAKDSFEQTKKLQNERANTESFVAVNKQLVNHVLVPHKIKNYATLYAAVKAQEQATSLKDETNILEKTPTDDVDQK